MAKARGRYFEQYHVGEEIETFGRTVGESDVLLFMGLSGDYNPIHSDAEFARNSFYGQRIAHGLLIQAMATGLATQTGLLDGKILAFRELSCKFSRPVFIGDTIHVKMNVTELRPNPQLQGGHVIVQFTILNQHGEKVQRGGWEFIVQSQPDGG